MEHLEDEVLEKGSFTITVGSTMTPSDLKWDLLNEDEEVVNSRSSVAFASLSTANSVTITSNDLGLPNKTKPKRYFVSRGTYNTSANAISDACSFNITHVPGVVST